MTFGNMNAFTYLMSLNVDYPAMWRLLGLITGQHVENPTVHHFINRAKKTELPDDYRIPYEDLLPLMEEVNLMVKSPDCPNNIKNKFYTYKLKIIRTMVKAGRVSDVYDESPCYALTVDGKYKFHQLKKHYNPKFMPPVLGKREYVHAGDAIPLDMEVFKKFEILANYHLGHDRETRQKGGGPRPQALFDSLRKYERETAEEEEVKKLNLPTNHEIYPVGTKVHKRSFKPFRSGLVSNTVTGVVNHNHKKRDGVPVKAYTFAEDDTIVECEICYKDEIQ